MQPHLESRGFTGSFGKAGLAEGTNAATIQIATAIAYAIRGLAYSKAVTDNIAVTAHAQQAVSTKCLYLVQIDKTGAVSTKKGDEVATADLTAGIKALHWPAPDKDKCPIGAYKVETDGATTFTNGTTDLGAAGITDTYYDFIGGMPDQPLTS